MKDGSIFVTKNSYKKVKKMIPKLERPLYATVKYAVWKWIKEEQIRRSTPEKSVSMGEIINELVEDAQKHKSKD